MSTEGQLLERAGKLTSEVHWVQEYHDRWVKIGIECSRLLGMCQENKSADQAAVDALTVVQTLAQMKSDKCATWLTANRAKLEVLLQEVNPQ